MIKQIVTGRWKENCYVIDDSGDCFVVDPGDDSEAIIHYIESSRFTVRAVVNTHGHFDHIGAVSALKKRFDVPFYLHFADRKQLQRAGLFGAVFDSGNNMEIPVVDGELSGNRFITAGPFTLEIVATPGHTKGSVCIYWSGYLFTGDTLFKGSIGRTDLPGGSRNMLVESLKKISTFPGGTILCPGHGDMTTLEQELHDNTRFTELIHEHKN